MTDAKCPLCWSGIIQYRIGDSELFRSRWDDLEGVEGVE